MARKRCVWLLRAKNHTTVSFEKQKQTCVQIANTLPFNKIQEVSYHDKAQWQWVAEASIVITRDACMRKNQKRTTVAGKPVEARLVVSRWYYWRWKIERFFKRLKSAGQNL